MCSSNKNTCNFFLSVLYTGMELRDARKINSQELHDRRKQVVLLFEKGLKRCKIAPLVEVSAYIIGQWIKA